MYGKIDYEKELNAEQLAVVQNADGPCLVLAGAGSGKTRTIVYRVAWLVEHGTRPDNILLLTFTNKAANEMMARIGELLGGVGDGRTAGIWGGTFHSVANRILRRTAKMLDYTSDFSILDQDDSKSLIKACVREVTTDADVKRLPSPAVIQEIVSYSRNAMIPLPHAVEKMHPKFAVITEDILKVAAQYGKKKKEANAMDFDDLLENWYLLLQRESQVRERMAEQFRYILVDEFQDTNALQNAIIRLLAGSKHDLLVVGDDAQSIYSFRAADVRNILDFPRQYPGAKVFKLETNYRSTPEILDLANDIISRNVHQFTKNLTAVAPRHAKPAIVPLPSASREAEFILDRINDLLAQGVRPENIAVLFRATFHSQALEFELMRRGLDYDYRGGLKFFDRAHVKDMLSFLRIRNNFADEAAWLRLLGMQTGIGEATADKLFAAIKECGGLAKVTMLPVEQRFGSRPARGWRDFRDTLEALIKAGDRPTDMMKAVLKSPYVDYLEAEYPNYRERLEDLEQMAKFAEDYDDASAFLAEVTLDEGALSATAPGSGRKPAGANRQYRGPRIVLSTIHQAKGLEWDAVFVIHLTANSFPNRSALMEEGGMEEERRLFYVAVTRARKWLYLSHPATIGRDMFNFAGPSMFLEEVTPTYVEGGERARRRAGQGVDEGSGFVDDEPSVEVGEDGEVREHSMTAVRERMKKVNGDWKKKSFLRDI